MIEYIDLLLFIPLLGIFIVFILIIYYTYLYIVEEDEMKKEEFRKNLMICGSLGGFCVIIVLINIERIYQIVDVIKRIYRNITNRNIRRNQILPSTENRDTNREAEQVNRRIPFEIPAASAAAAD